MSEREVEAGWGVGVATETQADVVCDVVKERLRQDEIHGPQAGNSDLLWVAIHGEEFGEVSAAVLAQKDTDPDNLYDELIQLAATCVAHAEALRLRGER